MERKTRVYKGKKVGKYFCSKKFDFVSLIYGHISIKNFFSEIDRIATCKMCTNICIHILLNFILLWYNVRFIKGGKMEFI